MAFASLFYSIVDESELRVRHESKEAVRLDIPWVRG